MKLWKRVLRSLNRRLAYAGPYRFCEGPWQHAGDINVLAQAIQTENFRKQFQPVPLEVTDFRRYCLISPHQDDEAIGAGGAMKLATNAGAQVKVIYVYDGAEIADNWTPEEVVEMRRREAAAACAIMGSESAELGISNITPAPNGDDLERLVSLLREWKPEVILTPWLFDSPPKHRLANYLLTLALAQLEQHDCEIWGYQVHNTLFSNGYVEITTVADVKRKMLQCFESQLATRCRHDHLTMGMNAWNGRFLPLETLNSEEPYFEMFMTLPKAEFMRLVQKYYLLDPEETYAGQKKVIQAAAALQGMANA